MPGHRWRVLLAGLQAVTEMGAELAIRLKHMGEQ